MSSSASSCSEFPGDASSGRESRKDKKSEQRKAKRKYRCRVRSPATIERAKKTRRDKANARERRRMDSLNDALDHLRTLLPQLPSDPKMTKIETLRMAQGYIHMLSSMLAEDNVPPMSSASSSCDPSPTYSTSSSYLPYQS